jgi:hypothetical protein
LQGKCKWAKVQAPDLEYKNWNIKLYPTAKSIELFNKLREGEEGIDGILNSIQNDEEGDFIILRRPMFKNFGRGDEPLEPPTVINSEGQPMARDVLIGDGSDITVKVERYVYNKPFKKGRGSAIRLVGVKVENLVPYSRKDFSERQEKDAQGLEKQPQQEGW